MATDDHAITVLFNHLKQAWTDNDAVAYGACFTEDSDYVSFDGTRAIGRGPMQHAHDQLFRGVLAGSALVGGIESIRYLGHDVAVVHGTASVRMPWRSAPPKRRLSRQTLVAVRTPEGWRFTALHNGRVRPIAIPAPDSVPSRLARGMGGLARALGIGGRVAAR
ncbi:SgcJ/EcaC family oxidoreductase [Actinoplanes sp. NEAU-A12]|uniref:SgcJ/EcaC family oxidoreductase n=1 Tax=Actinoplanes sandaracinus TaxID=3045177 RepID=A0ABT6WGQ6_9ACTN|nr:SgcJ/EcaC family oxidoreductase [Actinoplanes sandaracinus]MDI6098907.1 SgcJ/EcaC family oxidoreductase [Actinoplanes sandaracinus]